MSGDERLADEKAQLQDTWHRDLKLAIVRNASCAAQVKMDPLEVSNLMHMPSHGKINNFIMML
jgi:hypothetical protein